MKTQIATSKPKPPNDLWEQIDAIAGAPIKDAEGVSIAEFAERHRMTDSSAGKKLAKLAEEGKLIVGWRKHPDGRFYRVYRPA